MLKLLISIIHIKKYMNFFSNFNPNFNPKVSTILKVAGLAIVGVIVLALFIRLLGASFNFATSGRGFSTLGKSVNLGGVAQESASYDMAGGAPSLSSRNVISGQAPSSIYRDQTSTGDTAEAFEVTEYYANIESRQLKKTCQTVADLKARPEVIFETASDYDRGCNFVFKVKRAQAEEILAIIKKLNPKDLTQSIYTIKGQIDDYTSETEILQKKLLSIDETLSKALSAYDEVTILATRVKDVESLAKVIDSRINVIERLTQERLNISSQLDRIQRSKAEQLDRLEYTVFRVNIVEDKFIDGENLVDSWKTAIKQFVYDVNRVAQDISVNLITVLLRVFQYAIYLLIIVVVVKYGWKLAQSIWKK